MTDRTETDAAQELGQIIGTPKTFRDAAGNDVAAYAIVPDASTLRDLEDYLPRPRRIRQKMTLATPEALVHYTKRFADTGACLFVNLDQGVISAELDYHEGAGLPSHSDHKAILALSRSLEFARWEDLCARPTNQKTLARFIDEHFGDIQSVELTPGNWTPSPADMMEVARGFRASTKGIFVEDRDIDTGSFELVWKQEVSATGKNGFEVPKSFFIKVPIWHGTEPELIHIRFMFEISESGGLQIALSMPRIKDQKQAAVRRISEYVREGIGSTLPMYEVR